MIYLIAPYSTGIDDPEYAKFIMAKRKEAINKAAAHLLAQGEMVYSPVTHGSALEEHMQPEMIEDHDMWMRHCFHMLDKAERCMVLRLPGWEKSSGVADEMFRAHGNRQPITFMEPL